MSKHQQLLASIVYRECVLAPLLYTDVQDGKQVQGYGFMTVYMGLYVTAYCGLPENWLISVDAALEVGKVQIDLDCLKLKHCMVECLR